MFAPPLVRMTIPTLLLVFAWGLLPRTPGDTSLSGIVVDERGAPVADAEVRIAVAREAPRLTRTGAQGRFKIDGLASGRLYRLVATAEGYAPLLASGALEESTVRVLPPLRLVLPWGRTATGQVVDEACQPIAGARVRFRHLLPLRDLASRLGRDPLDNDLYVASSGADGRFVTPPLTFPRAEIEVWAEGFLRIEVGKVPIPESPDAPDVGTFVLRRGAATAGGVTGPDGRPIADTAPPVRALTHEIRGRVLGPDGAPVPRARLVQGTGDHLSGPDGIAAEDGVFALRLPDGSYTLAAEAEGLAARSIPVTVAGVDVDGLEIRPPRGCPVAGRVLGLLPGEGTVTRIFAMPPAGSGLRSFQADDADEAGRYRIADLAPGEWTLTAYGFNTRQAVGKLALGPGEPCAEGELDLAMPEEFEVRGRVVDPTGRPIARASLALFSGGVDEEAETLSGEDGGFTLSAASGTHTLWVTAGEDYPGQSVVLQVDDAAVDSVEVVLHRQ